MPFRVEATSLPGVVRILPEIFEDSRGHFLETYKRSFFREAGLPDFVQDNQSRSKRGTLRGLHFQRVPRAQGKLVRVIEGEVFDVAVDLREGSPHFGKAHATRLSGLDGEMLYLPPWCAHGFCVLSETADVAYKTTEEYDRDLEGGVAWDDPDLGIDWPVDGPRLSSRDAAWPRLRDQDTGFRFEVDTDASS